MLIDGGLNGEAFLGFASGEAGTESLSGGEKVGTFSSRDISYYFATICSFLTNSSSFTSCTRVMPLDIMEGLIIPSLAFI